MSRERYIGGKTGGIPEEVFSRTDRGYFTAQSGIKMRKDVGRSQILLSDGYEPELRFSANMHPGYKLYKIDVPQGLLDLTVRNKGFRGQPDQKHPDLYPSKLLKRSKRYFEAQGYTINGLVGHWTMTEGLTENLDQYKEALEKMGDSKNGKIEAAKNTWNGKVAGKLGFNEVLGPYELTSNNILVIFTK